MTEKRFLYYARHLIDEDDIAAVADALRSDFLTQGPRAERLEAAIAERVGARYCVAVNSGTSALHIACLAAGMASGKTGLTSANTFVASANAMAYCGARPGLLDIDPDTLGIDVAALRERLAREPETALVMPVSFAGLSHDAPAIREAAGGRIVVEDASHTLGGSHADGTPVGNGRYADMTVFSFHPVKPVTMGEGGCVVTDDPELARLLRMFGVHGVERDRARFVFDYTPDDDPLPWHYEQQLLGFNYRLTDIQAALGLSQLSKLDRYTLRRREIAAYYDERFRGLAHVELKQSAPDMRARSAHHLYVVHVDFAALGMRRTAFLKRMNELGAGAQLHYIPVYRQPYHVRNFGFRVEDHPNCERHYARTLSLPLHPGLTDEEVERVAAAFLHALGA
jgi:UDP-4-amino-4,6-dideoxy-N-acetyl-beta-L-altrosamine transaminase